MPRYVLTGTPGAGKTAVLRLLEVNGHAVVEEAATDVIALDNALGREEPWRDDTFIDKVVALQLSLAPWPGHLDVARCWVSVRGARPVPARA